MVHACDGADLDAVAQDRQPDELVVVPGVVLAGLGVGVLFDPEDDPGQGLSRGAVVDPAEERDGVTVVPAELVQLEGLARPR